jgi:CubicO group peptidase (beta-lactamase class C family)
MKQLPSFKNLLGGILALIRRDRLTMNMNMNIEESGKRVSDYLDRLVLKEEFPGIQYIVIDANSIVFNYVGGICDAATRDKVTEATSFLSSSTTKVLTAAAVLKLVEAGKVSLDDPLSKYCDKHPYGDEINVRHLLNQSSGIPNPMPLNWLHTNHEHGSFSESEALAATLDANPKLDFTPGEKYSYSNLSYWLLGKVIEKASGMAYSQYMKSKIFNPLGISHEELSCEISDERQYARGHQDRYSLMTLVFWVLASSKLWDKSDGKWARFQILYMNGPAYGGIFGTALGYSKFLQDMLRQEPRLFSCATKALFFEDQMDKSGNIMPTTLGWHRGQVGEQVYYGKPGGGPGYSSNIRIYPQAGIATVCLSNKTQVSEGPINNFSDMLDAEFLRKEGEQKS